MLTIQHNQELKELNTFGISAKAAGFAEFRNKYDLDFLFSDPQWSGRPWYVIGGGSNILLSGNYPGLLLHPVSRGIEEIARDDRTVTLRVQAGENWDSFVAYCVKQGYGGVENLSDIPGTVGACPVQNIGAYGSEVRHTITEVEAYLAESGQTRVFSNAECRFGYRNSIFKQEYKGRAIVISVTFSLQLNPSFHIGYGDLYREVEARGGPSLLHIREAILAIRSEKLPDLKKLGNGGSFFKNPVVTQVQAEALKAEFPDIPVYPAEGGVKLAAGWLIDRAGLKGYRQGSAGVHEKQALVLVNYGKATGKDILALAEVVVDTVKRKFGIELGLEINIL